MRTVVLTLILAICLGIPLRGFSKDLLLRKGDRIAIVGDSITEQKRYTKFIELYLLACVPELQLTTYQFGWSGERAPGFAARMENDMVPWKPTVVTTCYGMNDGSYRPYTDQIGKTYEQATLRIQTRCKELGARMIVGGPGPVGTEAWNSNKPDADQYYNENLAKLSEIAGRKNLPSQTAEIKWGDASKTFTKAELEAGINLADAFIDNPFSGPFLELDRVVSQKQERETKTIKGMITKFRGWAEEQKIDSDPDADAEH